MQNCTKQIITHKNSVQFLHKTAHRRMLAVHDAALKLSSISVYTYFSIGSLTSMALPKSVENST